MVEKVIKNATITTPELMIGTVADDATQRLIEATENISSDEEWYVKILKIHGIVPR